MLFNINVKCVTLSFSVLFVVCISHDAFSARRNHRVGTLNMAKSWVAPIVNSGMGTNDPCPVDIPGFGDARCRMCIDDLTKKSNDDIKTGSFINPITEQKSGGNVYELCGRYLSWPGCFNDSLAGVCASKIAPVCKEENSANGFCNACITAANTARRWWNRPAWWFKNEIYAKNAADCDGSSGGGVLPPVPTPPTPGTCHFSVVDVSGFSAETQDELFNVLKVGVPGAVGLSQSAFFGKTDWAISDLKVIKSNLNNAINGSGGAKDALENVRSALNNKKLQVAQYESEKKGVDGLSSSARSVKSAATFSLATSVASTLTAAVAMGTSIHAYRQSDQIKKKTYLMNNLINK